jgi:hypothetical protein
VVITVNDSIGIGALDHFAISSISTPQTVGTPITGIILTAQDATNNTDTSFSGFVTFGGTAGITGTSANFTSGVLSGISITPTAAGSNLTLTTTDGTHNGSTTITSIKTPYEVWANGAAFDADSNGDGINNGLAWLLGATNPSGSMEGKLPVASLNGNKLRLSFRCLKSTKRSGMQLRVQSSGDLGTLDSWTNHETLVPDNDVTVNGVIFDTSDDGDFIYVIADIPVGTTSHFARLSAVGAP